MRRTKEEAEKTRRRIMAAALRSFGRSGISSTTLEEVANAAGVTRGAIYWHFSGKEALLHAIREEVSAPLLDQADFTLLSRGTEAPLDRISCFLLGLLEALETDKKVERVLSVMSFKCEYVGPLAHELKDQVRNNQWLCEALAKVYKEAMSDGSLRADLAPSVAALETTTFVSGLLRLWLLDDKSEGMRKHARALVAAHVDGRRARHEGRQ
jgi:TetR/AcrR family acrAB operon transcriptional repressor